MEIHMFRLECELRGLEAYFRDLKLVLSNIDSMELSSGEENLTFASFPDVIRKGHIVTLLIVLEDQFSSLCKLQREIYDHKLKWSDFRGSALERFMIYCESVCGIKRPVTSAELDDIKCLIELRNCIVHNSSDLDGFNKANQIFALSKRQSGLDVTCGFIELSHEACLDLTDIAFEFIKRWYIQSIEHLSSTH
ncbi:hypothetical protein HYO42_22535 [Vibrio parahaemolyticus]|uniref:hypothetical protein n=1 Tax=Vibrio parahaemolyticus TaxID=670 RepID=UPI0009F0869B|nr:hypothetical protein [Vibrio parahaemolyticus]EIQ1514433.1 hypothetical protein [Vibrio parahaemolyticus]EJT1887598.1 hypothetical protein [Vibrio parahaemolyticus]ELB2775249.1 hypothetical protein [Vibrio parahaemolyticus]MBM4887244.1 hypothetical protein [Vibrio parahaemolyticus]OQT95725.1 hypothetical protein EN00_022390 [Vibrio parahaemolyticus]